MQLRLVWRNPFGGNRLRTGYGLPTSPLRQNARSLPAQAGLGLFLNPDRGFVLPPRARGPTAVGGPQLIIQGCPELIASRALPPRSRQLITDGRQLITDGCLVITLNRAAYPA